LNNPIKVIDERIRRKLAGIRQAFRGVVTLVNAVGAVQLVQGEGLSGETLQGAEYFQHFGFTSNMPEGTMYVTIPLGGKTAHCVIVGSEHADHRLKGLLPGESALYNAHAMKFHLTKDGIVVDGGGKPITVQNVSDLTVTNSGAVNVTAGGKATVTADTIDINGGGDLHGCVGGGDLCAFTGGPHPQFSASVKVSN
jgi:phage baseplate assembly protein V